MKKTFDKIELKQCPVCNSGDIKFLMKKYDDRYWYDDEFNIYNCLNCKCSFIKNPVNEKYLNNLYSTYYHSENYSNNENSKISRISNIINKLQIKKIIDFLTGNISLWYFIKSKWKILDYWCGDDLNAKISKTSKQDWIGMDINYKLVEKLQNQWYKCYHWTLDNIDDINEKFDYILMSQVIEHTYNPLLILKNAKKLLNKWWKIVISTPNLDSRYIKSNKYNWINWHVPYHTILFKRETFEYVSEMLDFKIKTYKTITPVNW